MSDPGVEGDRKGRGESLGSTDSGAPSGVASRDTGEGAADLDLKGQWSV